MRARSRQRWAACPINSAFVGTDLGFATYLVADGCFTFGRKDWNGVMRSAEDVHAMSLANLDGEYCTVVSSADVLAG